MGYTVQYTISTLSGQFALKYSATLHHAERLKALLLFAKVPETLAGFASGGEERHYDGYEAFNGLMKAMKYVMKHPERKFCVGIEKAGEETVQGDQFRDADEAGEFEVYADGRSMIRRGDVTEVFEEVSGKNATYRGKFETLAALFKEDLMNLLNLCEETMAKNGELIATQVSDDTPEAARLIQVPRH